MDEERRPDGLDRVRRQWEHLRIARERAENERRPGGLRGPVRRAAAWRMSLVPFVFT
jgi:hypothetical protein